MCTKKPLLSVNAIPFHVPTTNEFVFFRSWHSVSSGWLHLDIKACLRQRPITIECYTDVTLPRNCASSKFHGAQRDYYKSYFVVNQFALNQMDTARHYQNHMCNTLDVKIVPHSQAVDVAPRLASSAVRQHTRPIPLPLCRGNTVIHPSGIRRACACFLHLLKVLGYRTMQLIARLWSLRSALRAVQHNDQISEGPANTVPLKGCNAEFTTAFSSTVEANCKEPICMQ